MYKYIIKSIIMTRIFERKIPLFTWNAKGVELHEDSHYHNIWLNFYKTEKRYSTKVDCEKLQTEMKNPMMGNLRNILLLLRSRCLLLI